jgi:hypothetical protein
MLIVFVTQSRCSTELDIKEVDNVTDQASYFDKQSRTIVSNMSVVPIQETDSYVVKMVKVYTVTGTLLFQISHSHN